MGFSCRLIGPVVGVLLLAGEAAIAVLALWFPHETEMYREFYVEQIRECYLPAAAEASAAKAFKAPEIIFSGLSHDAACYVLARGWTRGQRALPSVASTPSSQAASAWLEIPPPQNAVALELTLANASPTAMQAIQLSVDRTATFAFVLPPGNLPTQIRVPIPGRHGRNLQIRIGRPTRSDMPALTVLSLKWITDYGGDGAGIGSTPLH